MESNNFSEFKGSEDSNLIISLFSTYVIIMVLYSDEVLPSIRKFYDTKSNIELKKGVLNGFKLFNVILLNNYIRCIIDNPNLLGVKVDVDYYDYTNFTQGRGRYIARSSTRASHLISSLVERSNKLLFKIIGINDWEYILEYKKEIQIFAENLHQVFINYYVCTDGKDNKTDPGESLYSDSIDVILSDFIAIMPIKNIYTDHYIDFNPKEIPEYDEVFDKFNQYESRFDPINLISEMMPKQIPPSWALGFSVTLQKVVETIVKNQDPLDKVKSLNKEIEDIGDWHQFDGYTFKLFNILVHKVGRHRYFKTKMPLSSSIKGLLEEPKARISPERVLSIIGNRARIVDASTNSNLTFTCLLDGVIANSKPNGRKARLALFKHKLDEWREDYSIGILLDIRGLFTNDSTWWIFYLIGNNHSGTASRNMRSVMEKIRNNDQDIDLDTFEVDEDEFYKYCEDPGYVRLDTEIKSIDQMVGKLRGTYPELLIANLLTNSGYQIVRLRFAPNFLSNYEDINGDLDVIGVKTDENTSEISIFESKGRARTDKDLNKELQKFSRTLRVLSQNQNALLKELGKNSSNSISVKGYFVSLADLKALDHNEDSKEKSFLYPSSFKPEVPENITLWDFNYFQNQLTANNVPEIYRNLLKNMPLAISLNLPTL